MREWPRLRLDECCEIVGGATPSTSVGGYWDGDICWATPKDLSELEGAYISDTHRKLTREGLASCAADVLPAGSVLFSSRAPIGHVALNTVPMATNQGFKSFIPKKEQVHANFLFHWLRTNRSYLESLGNGATFKEVSKAIVSRIEIQLPPLPEQRRLAEILDRTEVLRTKRRIALAQLDILTHAIFLRMFGDPTRNTLKLPITSIGEIGVWQSGGTPPRTSHSYFEGSVPWFSSGELEAMFVSKSREHISEEALRVTSARAVPKDALMLGMYDTAALKASIAAVDCSCNQAIAFSRINERIADTVYVYFAVVIGREHFRRQQRGVRQKNLNLSMIRKILIPLPPIGLQQIFASRVAAIEKLKTIHRASLAELNALFASLQHLAFRGEL
jgi:type I restriction enzyme S subunit